MPDMPLKPEWGRLGTVDPEKIFYPASAEAWHPGVLDALGKWWHATHASGGDMKWPGGGGGGGR